MKRQSSGAFAIAEIVTEKPLPEIVTCDTTLWAACIGGAAQQERYRESIESAGLQVVRTRGNPELLCRSAQGSSRDAGTRSGA